MAKFGAGGSVPAPRDPETDGLVTLRTVVSDSRGGAAYIAAQLRQAIADGLYRPGERLPPERRLAHAFGASRTTVRKALAQLADSGLLTRRIGAGTFVNTAAAAGEADIADMTSPLELIEVRLAVEPRMTRLAVLNATPRDLDRLSEALGRLEASGSDADHFSAWDQEFHLRLAQSTRNPLLVGIYRQINDVRGHAQWHAMQGKILSGERIAEYNRQHRALYEALRRRDADEAMGIMTAHLGMAQSDLMGAESR
ncbi:MAG: FadR/GntR family transcriptional regulator [Alphaproteobacteria bacterium]